VEAEWLRPESQEIVTLNFFTALRVMRVNRIIHKVNRFLSHATIPNFQDHVIGSAKPSGREAQLNLQPSTSTRHLLKSAAEHMRGLEYINTLANT
jgi:hypothetical protein